MTTQIRNFIDGNARGVSGSVKLDLLHKLDDFTDDVNAAAFIVREEGLITVSEDRTVRIWLKRDNGKYWPSICQYMASPATAFSYNVETRKLFVGTDAGLISEYVMSNDSNRLTHIKDYAGHNKRITAVHFALECEWVLSCGRDNTFRWYCSESGRNLGAVSLSAWATALEFDFASKYALVGDYSGAITILRIHENNHQVVTVMKGHAGSVRSLSWNATHQQLFSGGFDQNIVVWDIGGKEGRAYELQAHKGKVNALYYCSSTNQLLSSGDDGIVVAWDMSVKRTETPTWAESDTCQQCNKPFFWNFKMMYNLKTVGMRQHHCRMCGKAVCANCSNQQLTNPIMGFEYPVRVCDRCHGSLKDKDRPSHALATNVAHAVVAMDVDETKKRMITVGQDRSVKIWNLQNIYGVKPS